MRHLTMWCRSPLVLICYIVKIIRFPGVVNNEYKNTIPASLYAESP